MLSGALCILVTNLNILESVQGKLQDMFRISPTYLILTDFNI